MSTEAEHPTNKLFVYGTLRRGFAPHKYLGRASRFLGAASIRGRLYDLGEYPGAVASDLPGEEIRGEVYELRDLDNQLKVLDELEEFDPERPEKSLFVRRPVQVKLGSGEQIKAWVYFLPRRPRNARLISSGDYRKARPQSAQ